MSACLEWEVQRNRLLTGLWTSPWRWCPCCSVILGTPHNVLIVFHSLVTECGSGLAWLCNIICLPLTPTVVFPDPQNSSAPLNSWCSHFKRDTSNWLTDHSPCGHYSNPPVTRVAAGPLSLLHIQLVALALYVPEWIILIMLFRLLRTAPFLLACLWWARGSSCCMSVPNAGICSCASSSFVINIKKWNYIWSHIYKVAHHTPCATSVNWSFSSHWAHLSLQSHYTVTVHSPQYILLYFYSLGDTRRKIVMKDNFNTLIPSKTNKVGRWHARIF